MRNYLVLVLLVFLVGCGPHTFSVRETDKGYEIQEYTSFDVVLQTPLSSNINQRGDQFIAQIKEPFYYLDKVLLPQKTQIRGLVKRVKKYEKSGDRSGLVLLFDQIVLPDGRKIPLMASLDTEEGEKVVRIKGSEMENAKVIGGTAIVGALLGKATGQEKGTEKGLLMGVAVGTGAVLLADKKELKLPAGTELKIKLDEKLLIPKSSKK